MRKAVARTLDRHDRHILAILQADATTPLAEIAERVGLSASPCWRRIQRLRDDGIIARQVVIVNAEQIGLNGLIFVHIKLSAHGRQNLSAFTQAVTGLAEVVECFSLMGEYDFLLRVLIEDVKAYESFFYLKIAALPGVLECRSSVAMSTVKSSTAIDVACLP